MGRAVALREDFDGPALRRLAKASKDAGQSRQLLALAEIYDGCSAPGSLDTSLSHAAGLIEIAACHA